MDSLRCCRSWACSCDDAGKSISLYLPKAAHCQHNRGLITSQNSFMRCQQPLRAPAGAFYAVTTDICNTLCCLLQLASWSQHAAGSKLTTIKVHNYPLSSSQKSAALSIEHSRYASRSIFALDMNVEINFPWCCANGSTHTRRYCKSPPLIDSDVFHI